MLALIVFLCSLLLPAIHGAIAGGNLKAGTNALLGLMDYARQSAGTRNLKVELRLYQDTTRPTDPNGESPYRLAALAIPAASSGTSADQFLTTPVILPGDVVIDSSLAFSTVLNPHLGGAGLQPQAETEAVGAPLAIHNLPYIKITYLANGTIALDPSQKWCLTLVNEAQERPGSGTTPAPDFATLILDPTTSKARLFEP